jgi:hypothetical protein
MFIFVITILFQRPESRIWTIFTGDMLTCTSFNRKKILLSYALGRLLITKILIYHTVNVRI